jgi:TPR repeat protein
LISLLKLVIPLLATNCLVCSKGLHLIWLPNISAADPPKAEQAIRWFYPSASAGNARAQYNLGLCLQNGKGIKRNQKEAVRYLCYVAHPQFENFSYKRNILVI